jgi:hypothetical protein
VSVDIEQEGRVGCGFGTLVTVVDTSAPPKRSALQWIIENPGRFEFILFHAAVAAIITAKVVMRFVFSKSTMWVTGLSSLPTIISSLLLFECTLNLMDKMIGFDDFNRLVGLHRVRDIESHFCQELFASLKS